MGWQEPKNKAWIQLVLARATSLYNPIWLPVSACSLSSPVTGPLPVTPQVRLNTGKGKG